MTASQTVPPKGSKILVTGASGFLAVHVVDVLLTEGYSVVGTVRSTDKGEYLKKLFKGKPFEFVIVEDIAQPGAFDSTVHGIDGIMHTASPFHLKADDPEELIRPAVDGTVGILKSASKNGPDVKRVVITSSVAAIVGDVVEPPKTYTEKDWNDFSVQEVEKKGKDAAGGHKYRASKTLAEKAAWSYLEENKPSWGIATINPPLIYGPILHQCEKPESLNTSVANFYAILNGEKKESDLPGPVGNWVDVREVAYAHFKALTTPEAGGERFLISAGPHCTQDFTDYLVAAAPNLKHIPKGEKGAPAKANDPQNALVMSGKKAEGALGVKYRSIEDCAKDMYESLKERGWTK